MEKVNEKFNNVVISNSYDGFQTQLENIINNKNINEVYDKVLIITDRDVLKHQLHDFVRTLDTETVYNYVVNTGEESKTIEVYANIMNECIEKQLSRKSLIIALGGGVVGDLAGFVASTYMRGIDVVQVPTTLLSQVDSSIGGKTGINLGDYKNIIGSFYQPKLTYINIEALKTLSEQEFKSGLGEVIKYGLIYDYELLQYLKNNSESILNRNNEQLYYIVKKCSSIKLEVVSQDEKESGLRKILNFGHTFGHGIEKIHGISHGNAVSIGMVMALKVSLMNRLINEEYYKECVDVLKMYNLPTYLENMDENIVLDMMRKDKKNSFSKITLILPTGISQVAEFNDIDNETIKEGIIRCKNA